MDSRKYAYNNSIGIVIVSCQRAEEVAAGAEWTILEQSNEMWISNILKTLWVYKYIVACFKDILELHEI